MCLGIKWERGFTLLEVMVSLAIMAIALVTIIQLFSGALRSAKVSYDYSLAVMGAKKKMDEALAVDTMEEFYELARSGTFDEEILKDYSWEILEPEPYEIPEGLVTDIEDKSGVLEDLTSKLYRMGVRVRWTSGVNEKQISFISLKMLEEED